MKYKLAKDLPFANKGMEVEKRFNDELGVYFWYVYNHNSDEWWQLGCDLVIDKSWIEEIQPREFIVELYGKDFHLARIVEVEYMPKDNEFYKYIKVFEELKK